MEKKNKKSLTPVLILFIIIFTCAQASSKIPLIITGDNIKSRLITQKNGEKIYLTELTGNPVIKYGSSKLRADKLIIKGSEGDVTEAQGNVRLIDTKNNSTINASRSVFYKKTNIAEFTGNPSAKIRRTDDNSPVYIHADVLKYNLNEHIAEAAGNVKIRNNDLLIYSNNAVFNRNKKIAIFFEHPEIRKNDDVFQAEEILYYTDKRMIILNKNAYAVTYSNEKDSTTGTVKKVKMVATGDSIEHFNETESKTIIKGNATVEREDVVISGESLELEGSEGNEVLTGSNVNINYKSENVEAFGDHLISSRKDGYSALWSSAYMIFKDKNSGKILSRVYGDYMEYFRDLDELYVSGNVNIIRNDSTIKGDMAKYQRTTNYMIVTGNARIERQDSVLLTQSITVDTKNNDTRLNGDIKGTGVNLN